MARLRRKRPQRKQTDERRRKSPSCTDLEASDDKHVRRRAHLGKLDGSRVLACALHAAVTLVIGACAARRRSAGTTPCARDKTESATARHKTHREPTAPAVHRDEFDRAIHREAHDKLAASARKEGLSRTARWIGNGLAACAIAAALATSGLFCLISKPYTADPPSYAGDRVVVVERNVLLSGYGTVYYVPRGIGFRLEIARYGADDGYSPMSNKTYTLSWQGRTPTFEAQGTPADPVDMHTAKR